jgi:hypothetical protein
MRDHAITFHFSETETTISGPTFDRLPCQDLNWSPGSGMDLVVDHVAETLIVRRAQEDLSNKLPTGVAIIHDLKSARLIAMLAKEF